MERCPFCGSHNIVPLPLGDYLCLDCEEQFSEGERPSRYHQSTAQKVSGKVLSLVIKKGPYVIKTSKEAIPAILKEAKIFFF